jgi:hypothetical protein
MPYYLGGPDGDTVFYTCVIDISGTNEVYCGGSTTAT